MICNMLEADISPPKFHLVGESVKFERSFKGNLSEVPEVLHLIEEVRKLDNGNFITHSTSCIPEEDKFKL